MSVAETTRSGLTLYGKQSMSDRSDTERKTPAKKTAAAGQGALQKQRLRARASAAHIGSLSAVSIQGGTLQKTAPLSATPAPTPQPKAQDSSPKPKPPISRANTLPGFAFATASSKQKARPSSLSSVPPPDLSEKVIRGGTPLQQSKSASSTPAPSSPVILGGSAPSSPRLKKSDAGSNSPASLPGTAVPKVLQGGPPPNGAGQKLSSHAKSLSPSPISSPPPEPDNDEPQIELLPAAIHLASGSSASKRASLKAEKEETQSVGGFAISSQLMAQIKQSAHADHTLKMMEAALRGEDYQVPIHMDSPSLPEDDEEVENADAPRISVDSMNGAVINLLFPPKQKIASQNILFDDDMEIEIEPFYATAEEITQFAFTESEARTVKRVSFFRSAIDDAQLTALISQLPVVEDIDLNLCPNISDECLVAIARLKGLKIVSIRYCPKITPRGISLLPLESLVEFSFSSKTEIDPGLTARLAKSPELRRVDFNFCAALSRKAFLMLSTAHESFQISVHVKGCDQILQEAVETLNEKRNKPIVVHRGPVEDSDRYTSGIPRALEAPPTFPDLIDIFSMKTIPRVFKSSNPRIVPSAAAIEDMDFEKSIEDFKGFRGIDLSGPISDDALDAIVKRFPDMDLIRIYDSPNLGYGGLLPLRRLTKAQLLYLGRIPAASFRTIELLFSQDPQKTFQSLREVHLSGLPITDDVLISLSSLQHLERITISGCHRFTVQGLQALRNGCPKLEQLTMLDCPAIDQFAISEFRLARPKIKLEADEMIDGTIVPIATQEAQRRLFENQEAPLFFFPEYSKHEEAAVTEFYTEQLSILGVELSDSPNQTPIQKWRLADQILQAYMNISRVSWALLKELYRIGYFTNQDPDIAPGTTQGIVQLFMMHDQNGVNPYGRKLKMLLLNGLGVTQLPYFILDETSWPNLKTIDLQETHIEALPNGFKERCPKLESIVYSKERREVCNPLLSPRTNNLPPPPDMGDSKEEFNPSGQKPPTKLGSFFSKLMKKKE
ncbi:MAG: hypothetical protein K1X28_07470 [Parachlamydiales bacterium]|nr:hypothetical protein [Parachlamydiales bacterium]